MTTKADASAGPPVQGIRRRPDADLDFDRLSPDVRREAHEFPLGIAQRPELAYRTLLRRYRWRHADLAAALGWSVDEVCDVVDELHTEGLAAQSADDPEGIRAVEPRLALPELTVRRLRARSARALPAAAAVERFIALHERAASRIRDGHRPAALDEISIVVERLIAGVKQEVVLLVPGYAPGSFEFSEQLATTVLRRGAVLRPVWSTQFLHLPPVVAHARWLGARSATPRTVDRIPVRAMIMDRAVAVVVDDPRSARVVRASTLLDSLCRLADQMWERAADVQAAYAIVSEPEFHLRSETVLQLLADGLTDDAVARRIGVSVRTVRTEVATLMASMNARSRFQAGLRAAQLGLL